MKKIKKEDDEKKFIVLFFLLKLGVRVTIYSKRTAESRIPEEGSIRERVHKSNQGGAILW